MVAAARDSSSQQQQPQPQPPQAAAAATSAEDEALKRNTDCVYFLASPLTCKKGSECEYRHSEYARVNPRDCWFWLNGNCLNPKCAFRHPPLDGLLGTQAATSSGSSLPTSQTAAGINATYNPGKQVAATNATYYPGNQVAVTNATYYPGNQVAATHSTYYPGNQVAATNAAYNPGKQAVPCIFFQKGLCLKGDRCAFSHGLNPVSNKVLQAPAATPVSEPPIIKKTFGGLEKCSHEQKLPRANLSKSTEVPSKVKPAAKSDTAISKNGILTEKSALASTRFNDEVSSHTERYAPPLTNEDTIIWSNHMPQTDASDDHSLQNGKDADEFYRESSPGFDVLVDDELRDSGYYHEDDQFGRRGHEGRILNEFDVGGSGDYSTVADVDREMFHDPRGYDSYDRMQGQYDWKQRRASSERKSVGSDSLERRGYHKDESPDRMEESDLRHRLSKQRRVNGLRSVISHDYAPDNHDEERGYRSSRKDSRHLPPHDSSLSSRLRGRIKIPGRSPPVNDNDVRSERDLDRGRNFSRLSPGRTQSSTHQGRLQDRIKGRVQEDFNNDERNFRARTRRDIMTDIRTDFSGPKSLAELKVSKIGDSKEQQMEGQDLFSLGKRKNLKIEDHQLSECDVSFEGPKPLSEILKRKRGAETSVSGSATSSGNKENYQRESKERSIGSSITSAVTVMHSVQSLESEKEGKIHVLDVKENSKSAKVEPDGRVDGANPTHKSEYGQSSQVPNVTELEAEEGIIVDEGMEDHELEAYDQRDGDFDYEQVDGGDYNLDEGENADPEEEYLDDEDADDFDKKLGVMFS